MNFEELEHIVRAAKELTGETEFIAIGSQSLLISLRDLPRQQRRPLERGLNQPVNLILESSGKALRRHPMTPLSLKLK